MGHHNLPFRVAFELARLGFDAWMVVSLRTLLGLPPADGLPCRKLNA
jgi:hypothetical protein